MNTMETLKNLQVLELNFALLKPTAESNFSSESLQLLGGKLLYSEDSVLQQLILVQCDFINEDVLNLTFGADAFLDRVRDRADFTSQLTRLSLSDS